MDPIFVKNWFNFGNRFFTITDDEMQMVMSPQIELQWHITLKFVQTGAILGYAGSRFGLPLYYRLFSKTPTASAASAVSGAAATGAGGAPSMLSKASLLIAVKHSRNVMLGMAALSFPATYLNCSIMNDFGWDEYYDRAYRLRYNEYQLNVDRASILVGLTYGAFFKWFANPSQPFGGGFAKGVVFGTLAAAAYNSVQHKRAQDLEKLETQTDAE